MTNQLLEQVRMPTYGFPTYEELLERVRSRIPNYEAWGKVVLAQMNEQVVDRDDPVVQARVAENRRNRLIRAREHEHREALIAEAYA